MTYQEFIKDYIAKEVEKAGGYRKLSDRIGMNVGTIANVISGKYVMKPKTFLRYFPEAKESIEKLNYEVKMNLNKTVIHIECKELEELKKQLLQLGYYIEIKKIKP